MAAVCPCLIPKPVASCQLPLTQRSTTSRRVFRVYRISSYGKCCDVNYVITNVIAVTHTHARSVSHSQASRSTLNFFVILLIFGALFHTHSIDAAQVLVYGEFCALRLSKVKREATTITAHHIRHTSGKFFSLHILCMRRLSYDVSWIFFVNFADSDAEAEAGAADDANIISSTTFFLFFRFVLLVLMRVFHFNFIFRASSNYGNRIINIPSYFWCVNHLQS